MPEAAVTPARPRLAPGVRLHFDSTRNAWLLLAPERVIETDGSAEAVLKLCDGQRTVGQIVDVLAAAYAADRAEIAADVGDLLADLAAKRLVLL
ncbi:MAG: pyrroloquinoline quinone biosynthesis peptide chaperone PqqD [Acetobacteraceae bacterium]